MLPFTQEDFDPQLEDALELLPSIGDESVGVKLAINGLLSLSARRQPHHRETPEVKGLWSTAAIGSRKRRASAKASAEWSTTGEPEIDPASDIARFYDHHRPLGTSRRGPARGCDGHTHRPPDGAIGIEPTIRLSPAYDRRVGSAPSSSRRRAGSGRARWR